MKAPSNTTAFDTLFGELRSELQAPDPGRLHTLLVRAHALDSQAYAEVWLPYLASFSLPPLRATTFPELTRLDALIPAGVPRVFAPRRVAGSRARKIAQNPDLAIADILDLSHKRLRSEELEPYLASLHLDGLQGLWLRGNSLGLHGFRRLSARHPPRLRWLDLGRNGAHHPGVGALLNRELLSTLEVLRLDGNQLLDLDVEALVSRPNRFRVLTLGANPLTHVSLDDIAASEHLTSLEVLDLSQLTLRVGSIAPLLDAPNLSGLRRLHLSEPEVNRGLLEASVGVRQEVVWEPSRDMMCA